MIICKESGKIQGKYVLVSGTDRKMYIPSVYNRIFYGKPDETTQIYDNNTYVKEYTYLGFAEEVDENGFAHITQRNKFTVGEMIEIMKPDGRNITATVRAIYDEDGNSVESAPHPQQKLAVDLGTEIEKYDLLRRARGIKYRRICKTEFRIKREQISS